MTTFQVAGCNINKSSTEIEYYYHFELCGCFHAIMGMVVNTSIESRGVGISHDS